MNKPIKEIKLCYICKIALTEVMKDVYKCPACKSIVNERLDDRKDNGSI